MFGIHMDPNSIYVPINRTNCCKGEFDSTYPRNLDGIINQDEFRESIEKINPTVASNKEMKILVIVCILILVVAIILIGVGIETASSDTSTDHFSVFTLIGFGLFFGVGFIFLIGYCVVNLRQTEQIEKAVAEESKKYSSRSPIACHWRLQVSNICGRRCGDNSQFDYCIVITTGPPSALRRSAQSSSQPVNESSFLIKQENNDVPPPYSSLTFTFCSQCGAPRQDLSARFCSSCGQAFH